MLNLSASGQGIRTVPQVVCDDVIVCNAVDHIDWSARSVQWELCEACLVEGCSPGGRVALRRLDEHVAVMPDFTAMIDGAWEASEYAPPRWMKERGPLLFSSSSWGLSTAGCGGAPAFDAIAPASTTELLRLYHFLTPRTFLPDYLTPATAKWDLILCTSGPDSDADFAHLRRLFADPTGFGGHEFCVPSLDSYPVSVFLDLPTFSEWTVFSSEPVPSIRLSADLYFRLKSGGRMK